MAEADGMEASAQYELHKEDGLPLQLDAIDGYFVKLTILHFN